MAGVTGDRIVPAAHPAAPLKLRWNQKTRPSPMHHVIFVAASPDLLPAAALDALRRFPPAPGHKLVLQAEAPLRRAKWPLAFCWEDLPCGAWPVGDTAGLEEALRVRAGAIWAMAVAMLGRQ